MCDPVKDRTVETKVTERPLRHEGQRGGVYFLNNYEFKMTIFNNQLKVKVKENKYLKASSGF